MVLFVQGVVIGKSVKVSNTGNQMWTLCNIHSPNSGDFVIMGKVKLHIVCQEDANTELLGVSCVSDGSVWLELQKSEMLATHSHLKVITCALLITKEP